MKQMNLLLFLGASLLCSSGVMAQRTEPGGVLKSSRQLEMEWAEQMRENNQAWSSARPAKDFKLNTHFRKQVTPLKAASTQAETLILTEDFSKFTADSRQPGLELPGRGRHRYPR